MKAWRAYEYDSPTGYATVVFADTASRARAVAMATDCMEDVPYVDIRVNRLKEMDSHYRKIANTITYNNQSWSDEQFADCYEDECMCFVKDLGVGRCVRAAEKEKNTDED